MSENPFFQHKSKSIYRYRAVCRYISSHHVAHIITWVKYIILSTEKGSSPDLSEERLPPKLLLLLYRVRPMSREYVHQCYYTHHTYLTIYIYIERLSKQQCCAVHACVIQNLYNQCIVTIGLPSQLRGGGSINGPRSCLSISTSIPVAQPQWSHWSGILLVLNHSVIFFSKSKTRFL